MQEIDNFNELENIIKNEKMPVILFGKADCNPCLALKNKLKNTKFNEPIKSYYLALDRNPDLASKLEIYSAPTLILFIDGKVAIKEAGVFSYDLILAKINEYSNLL